MKGRYTALLENDFLYFLLLSMFTHSLQDIAHLLTLPLSSDVGSNPFLQELEAPFVFGNTQQLHGAFFIRREPGDFPDQITDKLVVRGLFAFPV